MAEAPTPTIIITLKRGIVDGVISNIKGLEVLELDYDTEGITDEGELYPIPEVKTGVSFYGGDEALVSNYFADYDPVALNTISEAISAKDEADEEGTSVCDECGATIPDDEPSMLSASHKSSCSLYEPFK